MRRLAGTLDCAFIALVAFGCDGKTSTPPATTEVTSPGARAPGGRVENLKKPAAEWSANEILQQLLATYRQAKSYQDQAVVRLAFRQGGQPVSQELPAAVAFERPGKLSIVAYQATVKCDGQELRARIDDPPSNHVDGQVVVRPAPAAIRLADLASDPLLYDILSSRLRRQPIQLELLIESGGLVSAFDADVACERLPDQQHIGKSCFRVQVPSPGGAFVFWVDQENWLLRRLDYPAAALVPDLASDPNVSALTLLADLKGAQIDAPIAASQFALEIPVDAKRMKSFVVPPRPLPSELFGQQPSEFYFSRLDGSKLEEQELQGKIAVLVWYHDNPACEATLQQVSAAHGRLKGNAAASFFAVATDPISRGNDTLVQRLAEWKVELPVVRDIEAFGDKAFRIEVQPTIVVLDKRGCVQIFQAGGSPDLADQLVAIVERLEKGEDLAGEIVAQQGREQREYEQLVARGGSEPGEIVELPEAVIRRKSEPKTVKLRPLWTASELKSPGNLLVCESPQAAARIFVIEGWRTIAELNREGQVVARHAPELPEQAAITFLRTTVDQQGRRYFLASSPLAPQLFLLDEKWRLLLAYPPADQAPLRVVDLAFAQLADGDAPPEIVVASAGDVGLVAVSLVGELRWRNRAFANALSVAVPEADEFGARSLLVAGEAGTVLRVNRFGNEDPPVTVPNWPIGRLVGGSFSGTTQAGLLGLATDSKGQPFAVGLTDKLKECWNYPLPVGVHQKPIEAITSSRILPGHAGEWWLAGPDGSIHLITADGELFDSFHTGAAVSGMAAGRLADKPVLLVATEDGVAAWQVQLAAEAKTARER